MGGFAGCYASMLFTCRVMIRKATSLLVLLEQAALMVSHALLCSALECSSRPKLSCDLLPDCVGMDNIT